MVPWEREVYVALLIQHIEKEEEHRKQQERRNPRG